MPRNEKKVEVRDTERIAHGQKGKRIVLIVRDSDIRISETRSDAEYGALIEDQDRAVYEMENTGDLYAYNDGNSVAKVEVTSQ